MSPHKKLLKAIQNLFREMVQIAKAVTKKLMNWLLRSILVTGKKANLANAGFILPTVTMVILVVILLTTAMVFRSFERSKNASNVRVSQATLAAATPALDRAKAKISALLADPTLPRATPTDIALNNAIAENLKKYTLGDETQLVVKYDINNNGSIQESPPPPLPQLPLENEEKIKTAWRFPVDTDNNGKPDSYTLYGIYFRAPNPVVRTTNPTRSPIEARTAPQDDSSANPSCRGGQGTFADLVGSSGWYKSGSVLKKSFYVFAATVPNTTVTTGGMEIYTGNRGFSAIEYQQDRAQIPLSNNAVVYEDDLEITPGSGIKLNGRIQTNGNLITAKVSSGKVEYYQVSSYESCFYEEENGKITVGGNVLIGSLNGGSASAVDVDLYRGKDNPIDRESLATGNQSVTGGTNPSQAAYNSQAFANRINTLVQKWTEANPNPISVTDPSDVKEKIPNNASPQKQQEIRLTALENYFKERMRPVTYAENTASDGTKNYEGSGDTLRPPDEWIYPVNPATGASNNSITLQVNKLPATEPKKQEKEGKETKLGDRIVAGNGLPAKWWDNTLTPEDFVGAQGKQPVKPNTEWDSYSDNSSRLRYRTTQVVPLSDLGDTNRDGFWELSAAQKPNQPLDSVGGLRVVTGAGVYTGVRISQTPLPPPLVPIASFLPPPRPNVDDPLTIGIDESLQVPNDPSTPNINESNFTVVWPDSMPMWQDTDGNGIPSLPPNTLPLNAANLDRRGDLVMRATAVYHYKRSSANTTTEPQTPIACVSSYYDPSTSATARNQTTLAGVFAGPPGVTGTTGRSNNGISYVPPASRPAGSAPANNATGLFPFTPGSGAENPANSGVSVINRLYYQANLIFPNGRFVNQPLRDALTALATNSPLTLAQQSAIDSTVCAMGIADGTLARNTSVIPDGAIYETSFLDAREIKAVEQDNNPADDANGGLATFRAVNASNQSTIPTTLGNYNLPLEERQPLEIRVTALDLSQLRQKTIGGLVAPNGPSPEYLLPDSGIIYATRDDALPDLSEPAPTRGTAEQKMAARKSKSPVDFKLDPTRKPNGIMLVNGSILARGAATPSNSYTLVTPPGAEKGLILATNLPAYVKADVTNSFNKHQTSGGTEVEEFTEKLGTNDYAQNYFYSRQNEDYRFACRSGQPGITCTGGGDLWRPATVLADSISLLSNDFRYGFRNEGDYDLRNNQGDISSIAKRKKQGFLNNNFVTNGLSSGATITATNSGSATAPAASRTPVDATYTSNTPNNNYVPSSYFNNFVTPIQRRGQFPQYLMEMCLKLPVSECTANDWVVGYDVNGNGSLNDPVFFDLDGDAVVNTTLAPNTDPDDREKFIKARQLSLAVANSLPAGTPFQLARLGAGTTARSAYDSNTADINPEYQRYARRVAFERNEDNTIRFTPLASGNQAAAAIPMGITGGGVVAPYSYFNGTTPTIAFPASAPNALAFRTTNNSAANGGRPFCKEANPAIGCTVNDITYAGNRPLYYLPPSNESEELLLPDVANIPGAPPVVFQSLNGYAPGTTPPPINNSNSLSDFAVCLTNGQGSNQYQVSLPLPTNTCSTLVPSITAARNALLLPALVASLPLLPGNLNNNLTLPVSTEPDNVYVYNVPAPAVGQPEVGKSGGSVTITLNGNPDSIFIFRKPSSLTFEGVTLKLNGVDPNNVFWVSNAGITFTETNKLAGNFLANGGQLNIPTTTEILGGRLLGFAAAPAPTIPANKVKAITSQAEPLLVPVLQVHLTNQTVGTNPETASIAGIKDNSLWLQKPKADPGTIFNLAAAGGDSPSNGTRNEQNGGLQNFVRFLENWTATIPARISGSFIQFKRSAYATAPFRAVNPTSLPSVTDSPFGYNKLYSTTISQISTSLGGGSPFYVEPKRFWGFDVALLSQLPDLFSQRFTTPDAGDPNEFYREVGRDDQWVQTLLCAKLASDGTTPAIDNDQRPTTFCQQKTGG